MNLEYVGASLFTVGIISTPILAGAWWLVPTPYLYVVIAGWAMVVAGILLVAAAGERDETTCRYCGDPVGGEDS